MLFIGLHVLVVFKNVIKTDRNLIIKLDEHGTKVDQPMYQHLSNCSDTTIVSKESHLQNAVISNIKILDKNNKWGQLQFLETYHIKKLAPEIHFGLKSSKELQLFE